ncbi:prolyl oligopeptidase family serine peptidase [bacterium]|nr:prolyl oligopeptidase family serine peptidase [bacterium]
MGKQVKPYGEWTSPITADFIVSKSIRLGKATFDGEDIVWHELRPAESGRTAVVRCSPNGTTQDLIPAPYNARTRVHEYGGGAYTVADGVLYFVNFADQVLYCVAKDGNSQPLTPGGDLRYADFVVDQVHNRLIAVCEDHRMSSREAVNSIVALPIAGVPAAENQGEILASGSDFCANPRLSPDGSRLSWITWNHPNMPWDGTELWVAPVLADGRLGEAELIAGSVDESIFQPSWSPDGKLYFVSDRTGWWNLYQFDGGQIRQMTGMDAEFGVPQWTFGATTYAFVSAQQIACTYIEFGISRLALLDTKSLTLTTIDCPYTEIDELHARSDGLLFRGGSPTQQPVVVYFDLIAHNFKVLRKSSETMIDAAYLSVAQAVEFPTEGGLTAHAFYYPPHNPDFEVPAGELPPLIVEIHGGPTGATSSMLDLGKQFWTSRGFAVLDVNYGGSTGYGRAYRERLKDRWGIVDVDDCCNGALFLAEQGLADPKRLLIHGGSAGGYTTLAALAFRDIFSAGASYYGVSDLTALAEETHKFESRYLDGLIGPYPEAKAIYDERSPIHHVEGLSCPVIFFQGLEDKIVLPNQAERMVEALKYKEVPVAYVPFEGEQHGFRRAENIKRTLEGELYFYSRIFGFTPADEIEPVEIENL